MITALVNTSLQVDDGAMNGSMGAFIERRMELLGLNQSQLARRAGVNRAHLSQVISGKIALPSPDFRRKLAAVLAARGIPNRRNLVFPSPTGDRLHPSTFSYQLRTRIEALALPAITPHQMRHTAATLLMESGVPPKVVQEML